MNAEDLTEPVLFLGEWCKRYSRRERWQYLNAHTASYHWDDREKLYKDYQYLESIYEEILKALTESLNRIHQTKHFLKHTQ